MCWLRLRKNSSWVEKPYTLVIFGFFKMSVVRGKKKPSDFSLGSFGIDLR
jgi:hypothetical protein